MKHAEGRHKETCHRKVISCGSGSQLTIVFGILNLIVAVVVDQFAEQRTKDVTNMANESWLH